MESRYLRQHSASTAGSDPITQFLRSTATKRERQYRIGRDIRLVQASYDRFHDGGGLPGSRTCQDQKRSGSVIYDGSLGGVEFGHGHACEGGQIQPRVHGPWIPLRCDTIDR
jgi:hypothetical protein